MRTQTTFILGAPDPEMEIIERIARQLPRTEILYAAVGGKRVRPFQAYEPEGVIDKHGQRVALPRRGEVVLVETAMPDADFGAARVVVVDHHRPGDPGYGKPPAQYLEGSSLGQVASLFPTGDVSDEEIRMAAAADHCLPHAYQGKCPGVDPDRLMRWRIESRARFQRRDPEEILRDVEATMTIMAHMLDAGEHVIRMGGARVLDLRAGTGAECEEHGGACGGGAAACYASIPELPEAAMRLGTPVLSMPAPGPRGRPGKVNLLGAPPAAVEAFLAGEGPAHGLVDTYGDPARGFAGGYIDE